MAVARLKACPKAGSRLKKDSGPPPTGERPGDAGFNACGLQQFRCCCMPLAHNKAAFSQENAALLLSKAYVNSETALALRHAASEFLDLLLV